MLSNFISQLALREFKEGDPKLAWELMHFDAIFRDQLFFKPKIEIELPIPPRPDPRNFAGIDQATQVGINASILTDLIRAAGDPDPQPNMPTPIFDRDAKLDAAKNVLHSLEVATARLKDMMETF